MRKISIPDKRKILKIAAIILVVTFCFIAIKYLWQMFDATKMEKLVRQLGIFGPIAIIFYIAFSHILVPVAGTPGVLAGAVLFGIPKTMFFIYIAGLISATVNFYISKKLGRKWVAKLAGKKTMQKIDEFTKIFGTKILILSRAFGFSLFEVISYAAGLTIISFKKYFLTTALFSAIPAIIFGIAFKNANLQSGIVLSVWIGTIIITGAIFTFSIKRFIAKNKKINEQKNAEI